MSKFTSDAEIAGANPFTVDEANPTHELGQRITTADGRAFRYVLVGSSAALVTGNLIQSPAEDTGDTEITPTATAIGATSITTSSTVTVTANQYAGGFVHVVTTPGLGQIFRIASHPAATAATVVLTLEDPIQVALTTSSRIDLILNPYNGVIQNPTTASGTVVGVAVNDITASQYGWIQTDGVASILDDGGIAVGTQVVASNGTAGAVEDVASTTQQIVGTAVTASSTGQQAAIKLNID